MDYQLSILLPSAYKEKRERFIQNLKETLSDFESVEIVICLDGTDKETWRDGNLVYTYSPPSKYRSTFFNQAWKASTGRFVLMANDDIIFKTKNWDLMIPYERYPDDLALFYFKDNWFNEFFSCHPIWSRKVMELYDGILDPLHQITKCDNTIWDIHPPNRRVYLPDIVLEHNQTPYGPEWKDAYDEDNNTYYNNVPIRNAIRSKILEALNANNHKVMIGIPTAEMARRADFYDHFNLIDKPPNSICLSIHGQSIAHNRNQVVEQALIHGCTHVFFLDDDVICKPDIIYRLLEHNKDIVTGLQLNRNFPHHPLLFGPMVNEMQFRILPISELSSGLIPISAAGLGCVLIKTLVFKNMEKPYFRFGEFRKDQLSEDTGFFKRAGEIGADSYCDLDAPVGHIASAVIRPIRKGSDWIVDYDTNGTGSIAFIPQVIK